MTATITPGTLTPAQESLFLTLCGRAMDNRLPKPFLGDAVADHVVERLDYDFTGRFPSLESKFGPKMAVFDIAVRAKKLDDVVRRFVALNPSAVVLDLGAGLDSRLSRVKTPSTVEWYAVDFSEVVDLRRRLLPEQALGHEIAADLTDPACLDDAPADRPAVVVADGLVPFLSQDELAALFNRIVQHFPSGELATNSYPTTAIRALKTAKALATIGGAVRHPGFNDPREPERWIPGLELAEETYLPREPEFAELPGGRLAGRLVTPTRTVARLISSGVFRYRFQR